MPIPAVGAGPRRISDGTDTGKGSRKGAVTARTQSKNPRTGDYTKRNETLGSPKKDQFMDVKSDGKPFKGVAQEPDGRRS